MVGGLVINAGAADAVPVDLSNTEADAEVAEFRLDTSV